MSKVHSVLLTKEGLEELRKEYAELLHVRRPELVARVSQARESGDLAENSEYAAARDDLAFVDGRISEIADVLNAAQTISHSKVGKNGKVDIGCRVKLHVNGKQETFVIVGEWEANPKEKKISHSSPLGLALMGKKVGQVVEVEAPVGRIVYKILKIE